MASRLLRLGHSPDSDDAFMFYALAAGKIDTGDLRFEHILQDIQTLNQWAREGKLEITAISAHAYAYVQGGYDLFDHGASMGDDYGPVVVAREPSSIESLRGVKIAVPGLLTSAYLALCLCLPDFEPVVMPFDAIMEAVAAGEVPAGLLIHEGQLTHSALGLSAVIDLGVWWRQETGLPLPLGVNAVRADLPEEVKSQASRLLQESIRYALDHRREALEYALRFARDLEPAQADRFVGMYVNDLTLDLGERGRKSIELFLRKGHEAGWIPEVGPIRFID
ncbi:MAG: ABC transporter substrate-binding protein [Armatimonadetes bacterium]|nr:ABC transporter substrate-binding protein [Armatimonadota bacterium]